MRTNNVGTARDEALTVTCPRCDSLPGELCIGARGDRETCHIERHRQADKTRQGQRIEREHRYYDDDPGPQPWGRDSIHPTIGRRIAYDACVNELMRRGHTRPEQRAAELLRMWLP